jgi:hypothetical protein
MEQRLEVSIDFVPTVIKFLAEFVHFTSALRREREALLRSNRPHYNADDPYWTSFLETDVPAMVQSMGTLIKLSISLPQPFAEMLTEIEGNITEMVQWLEGADRGDLASSDFDELLHSSEVDVSFMSIALKNFVKTNTLTLLGLEEIGHPTLLTNLPQAAVQYAFTHFEDMLRQRIGAGPEIYGLGLISEAFGKNGVLTYGATDAECARTRDFLVGAYGLFRNPRGHRLVEDYTGLALSLITVVALMMRIVEDAEVR